MNVVKYWNKYSNNISEFIICKEFSHDEITTDGYRKCVIGLLTKHGILVRKSNLETNHKWLLGEKWEQKQTILCLDDLSLYRQNLFYNTLINLPLSFTNAYKQSLNFQKALLQIIEVSGPLHSSFHVLQSIYIIFKRFLKCIQPRDDSTIYRVEESQI